MIGTLPMIFLEIFRGLTLVVSSRHCVGSCVRISRSGYPYLHFIAAFRRMFPLGFFEYL